MVPVSLSDIARNTHVSLPTSSAGIPPDDQIQASSPVAGTANPSSDSMPFWHLPPWGHAGLHSWGLSPKIALLQMSLAKLWFWHVCLEFLKLPPWNLLVARLTFCNSLNTLLTFYPFVIKDGTEDMMNTGGDVEGEACGKDVGFSCFYGCATSWTLHMFHFWEVL